jgi:hypothetical protein
MTLTAEQFFTKIREVFKDEGRETVALVEMCIKASIPIPYSLLLTLSPDKRNDFLQKLSKDAQVH